LKRILFTVTNDLNYDQRMQRICTSLVNAGYDILLIGRKMKRSIALRKEAFKQKRLYCLFNKGFPFYAEYNLRLFLYLLFARMDAVCAIDLDTILPCYIVSMLRGKKRVYDAHELFTEMKEVITRPLVKKTWLAIEKFAVPEFKYGYTVSHSIAEEFHKRYNVSYEVIRNMPLTTQSHDFTLKSHETSHINETTEKIILYQGAVNEARGLENLVNAMQHIYAVLHIYGNGNIYEKIKKLIIDKELQHKIILKGTLIPEKLQQATQNAYIGINLVEPVGLNQIYSLANKFFDYIQAGIPQLTMNFPEYKKINDEFNIAVLVNTVNEKEIADAINLLLKNTVLHDALKNNCIAAREILNWQQEETKLIPFYNNVFAN
jgi:glycosyltransferase involved in cell wall biosynthesis